MVPQDHGSHKHKWKLIIHCLRAMYEGINTANIHAGPYVLDNAPKVSKSCEGNTIGRGRPVNIV